MQEHKSLPSVYIEFEESNFNYYTNVSTNVSKDSVIKYFLGNFFNVGIYPNENLQKCIKVTYLK